VVDCTSPYLKEEIDTVDEIIREMNLSLVPRILVFNKKDLLDKKTGPRPGAIPRGLFISAQTGEGLESLINLLVEQLSISPHNHNQTRGPSPWTDHKHFEDQREQEWP